MSTKDDTSQDRPANGPPMVVHHGAPLGAADMDWGGVPAYSQGFAGTQTDPSVYLHAIRRHWFLGLLLGVILAGLLGGVTWKFMPRKYTATSLIQVAMQEGGLFGPSRTLQQEYDIFKGTQIQKLRSPFVLAAALRNSEINNLPMVLQEDDPVSWLQDELSVSFPGDAEMMQVSLSGKNPEEVTKIVKAVVDAYLKEAVQNEQRIKNQKISDLEEGIATNEQKIRRKRTQQKRLIDELGTGDQDTINLQMRVAFEQLSTYRTQMSRAEMELRQYTSDYAVAKKAWERLNDSVAPPPEADKLIFNDGVLRDLDKKINELGQAVASGERVAKSKNASPLQRQLEEQLRMLQEEREARIAQISEMVRASKMNELADTLEDLKIKVDLATEARDNLQTDVNAAKDHFEVIGRSSVDLEMAKSDLESLDKVTRDMSSRLETLRVENQSQPRIQPWQEAQTAKNYDNPMMIIALAVLASLAGLALPLVGIVLLDVQKRRINSSEDVAKGLGLPVMGSVPMIPKRGMNSQRWNLRLAESIDSIAAKLLRNATLEQDRVVLITSAVSGEGKTTLANQVAQSLARAGKKTVLVDFDLRRPAIDKLYGLELVPGVSDVLCGETEVKGLPQPTGYPNLEVITAGRCDRHALRALANGGDKRLFDQLREEYEFIIVDGSPILPVADSRYISQHVDSVVLSVFRDYSRAPKVLAACEILEAFGVHDLEAVVTSSGEDGYGTLDMIAQNVEASA